MTESEKFWMDVYVAFIRSGNTMSFKHNLNLDAKEVADQAVKDLDAMKIGGKANG